MPLNPFAGATTEDFQAQLAALQPPGGAWMLQPIQAGLNAGIADGFAWLRARTSAWTEQELDPAQTLEALDLWEADYGLPDPCTPLNPTIAQRQAALMAKVVAQGGQSPPYMIAVAAALGYAITITTFTCEAVGVSFVGLDYVAVPQWRFAWQVNCPTITVRYFETGISMVGEPLWTISAADLQCRLAQIAPAHTVLLYNFG